MKALANKRDVPYQSLLNVSLADRVDRETHNLNALSAATDNVQLKPAAERDLKKIEDKVVLARIGRGIDALTTNPRPSGVKPLQGDPSILRIRVGDYSILYTIEDAGHLDTRDRPV